MRHFAEDSYAPTRSLTVEAILSQIAISTLKHHHPPLKPGSRRVQSLCARRKPQWTVTFKHRYSRDRHFDRHGTEFAAKTPDKYEKMAGKFKYDPLPSGVKECRRSDGGIVRFARGQRSSEPCPRKGASTRIWLYCRRTQMVRRRNRTTWERARSRTTNVYVSSLRV